jgi:hypothetical protein
MGRLTSKHHALASIVLSFGMLALPRVGLLAGTTQEPDFKDQPSAPAEHPPDLSECDYQLSIQEELISNLEQQVEILKARVAELESKTEMSTAQKK